MSGLDKKGSQVGLGKLAHIEESLVPRNRNKSAEGWAAVMSDSGEGLAAFSDEAFKVLENADEEYWLDIFDKAKNLTNNFQIDSRDPSYAHTNEVTRA